MLVQFVGRQLMVGHISNVWVSSDDSVPLKQRNQTEESISDTQTLLFTVLIT
jgi:hypothetical protein